MFVNLSGSCLCAAGVVLAFFVKEMPARARLAGALIAVGGASMCGEGGLVGLGLIALVIGFVKYLYRSLEKVDADRKLAEAEKTTAEAAKPKADRRNG
jgi:hypothetical protein